MLPPRFLHCEHVLCPQGWASPGYLALDDTGRIAAVSATPPTDWDPAQARTLRGWTLPGMPNLHSHAFQRAMAGRAEHRGANGGQDNFWSWRQAMYDCAQRLSPEDVEAIAAQAFVEMLETGFTAVAEFHYLHHQPGGERYADPAELSRRVFTAARRTGIALTHLPVLYAHGGIGRGLEARQHRFAHADVDEFLGLVRHLLGMSAGQQLIEVGVALHSLRAVAADEMREALRGLEDLEPGAPIHVHVAEQEREVEECLARLGQRPIAWLFDHADVGPDWCLVHATHCDERERWQLATSGAVVGLCPTTEANLGDGVFPLPEFLAESGRFGIGTDSHVAIGVADELRTLEYGQRLVRRQRNLAASEAAPHTGRRLYEMAALGGAQALGQPCGAVEAGRRADLVVIDASDPRLFGHGPDTVLDAFVFSSAGRNPIREVIVAGQEVVTHGRHVRRDEVRADFERAVLRLQQR